MDQGPGTDAQRGRHIALIRWHVSSLSVAARRCSTCGWPSGWQGMISRCGSCPTLSMTARSCVGRDRDRTNQEAHHRGARTLRGDLATSHEPLAVHDRPGTASHHRGNGARGRPGRRLAPAAPHAPGQDVDEHRPPKLTAIWHLSLPTCPQLRISGTSCTGNSGTAGRGAGRRSRRFHRQISGRLRPTATREPGRTSGSANQRQRFERKPQLMALSTSDDQPVDWLRAGQALQRAILTGTRYSVSAPYGLGAEYHSPRRYGVPAAASPPEAR